MECDMGYVIVAFKHLAQIARSCIQQRKRLHDFG